MDDGELNQSAKMEIAEILNSRPGFLSLGRNEEFLKILRSNKEFEKCPYYWISKQGQIHCHCPGNPPAEWLEEKDGFMCFRRTKHEGK